MTGAIAITDFAAAAAPGADGFRRVTADAAAWEALASGAAAGLHDLLALWLDGTRVHMALSDPQRRVRAVVALNAPQRSWPSVGRHHPPALRLERTLRDLHGARPEGIPDERGWLDHGAWPKPPPMRRAPVTGPTPGSYAFLPVEGESLHQIPVGPVHAGIIEPGHFRFTANGETVVRLEERLGYVHKGVEALCAGATIDQAARIAGRISGDSTVACSLAFALATEAALRWRPPARASVLRGIMAELERIAQHVADVGAICNDASVMAILARCMLVREDVLRTCAELFGHRLMMDRVVPGGVAVDLPASGEAVLRDLLARVSRDFEPVVRAYDTMPSLQDRTVTTGIVKADYVRRFAAGGYVGRASGRAFDARAAYPYAPYDGLDLNVPTRATGDVDGRIWVRIEEVRESARVIGLLLERLPAGPIAAPRPDEPASGSGSGSGAALVEAFRGDLFIAVRIDAGRVAHLHARDASWFQWPLLETAIEGNIVADFPLCNKSFNCSYSGHDG